MQEWLGGFSHAHWKLIVLVTLAVLGISAYGITRIDMPATPDRVWAAIDAAGG